MNDLFHNINKILKSKNTVFIAIDGLPGSGKTTLCKIIKKHFPLLKIVKIDSFYDPAIKNTNFERLKKEIFYPIKKGKIANYKLFDFKLNTYKGFASITPGGLIILEGISSMDRRLVDLYDYKIWIDCPVELALKRVLARDNKKYEQKWKEDWMPEILYFINNQKPYAKADVIINYQEIPKI
jgi:uridine kinase